MKLMKIFFITFLLTSACFQNDYQQDEFKNSSLNANESANSPSEVIKMGIFQTEINTILVV